MITVAPPTALPTAHKPTLQLTPELICCSLSTPLSPTTLATSRILMLPGLPRPLLVRPNSLASGHCATTCALLHKRHLPHRC